MNLHVFENFLVKVRAFLHFGDAVAEKFVLVFDFFLEEASGGIGFSDSGVNFLENVKFVTCVKNGVLEFLDALA